MSTKTIPQRILKYVKENAHRGDVASVVDAIDDYCNTTEAAMNVGSMKGEIIDGFIRECKPKNALELGTYAGYSALRIARTLGAATRLYTIEADPSHAAVAKEMIDFAGLQDRVEVLVGKASDVLPTIAKTTGVRSFDFVFLDHFGEFYKKDLIRLEKLELLRVGTVVVADNVIYPGCPDYVKYVRNSSKYSCTTHPSNIPYMKDMADAMEKSVFRG